MSAMTEAIEVTATVTPNGVDSGNQETVGEEGSSPEPKPPATPGTDLLPVGRVPVGVAPLSVVPAAEEIRALASLAVAMAKSEIGVSKSLRDKPNAVLAVFLTARGLGVDIMTALRTFHVIEGQVTLSPKIRLAMAQEIGRDRGWKIWPDKDNDRTKAVWHCQRPETPGLVFSSEYTWVDAQEAEMVSWDCQPGSHTADCRKAWPWKDNKPTRPLGLCKDNWRKFGARMLSWRAVGYLLDDRFPEVGQGLYSPDELGAITDEEGNPVIDVASVEAPAGMKGSDGRVSGASLVPEPPGVAKISEEIRENLKARIAVLPDGAKEALREWWVKVKGDGTTRPGLSNPAFTAADSVAAQAFVAQVERRVKAGEWAATPVAPVQPRVECGDCGGTGGVAGYDGTMEPCGACEGTGMLESPPEKPLDGPVGDDLAVSAVTVPESSSNSVETAVAPTADVSRETLSAAVKAQVAAMDNATVSEYLATVGQSTKGSMIACRARLEVFLVTEAVEAKWAAEKAALEAGETGS